MLVIKMLILLVSDTIKRKDLAVVNDQVLSLERRGVGVWVGGGILMCKISAGI